MDELPNKLNHFLYIVNNKLSVSINYSSKKNADHLQNYFRLFEKYELLGSHDFKVTEELLSEIQQYISKLLGAEENFIPSYDSSKLDTLHENIQKEFNVNTVYEIINQLDLKHVVEIEKYLNFFKVKKMICKVIDTLMKLVWLIPWGKFDEKDNMRKIIELLQKSRDENLTFNSDELLNYLEELSNPEFFRLYEKAKTREENDENILLNNASHIKDNSEEAKGIIIKSKLNKRARQLCDFWNKIIPVQAQLKSIQSDIKKQIKPNLERLERLLTFEESVDDNLDSSKQIIKYIEDSRYVSNERVYNKETKELIFELVAALITNYKSVIGKLQDLNSINVGWRDFLSLALNNDKIPTFNARMQNIAIIIKEEFNKKFNPAKATDYYDEIEHNNGKNVRNQLTDAKFKIIFAKNTYENSRRQPTPSKRNQQENEEDPGPDESEEPFNPDDFIQEEWGYIENHKYKQIDNNEHIAQNSKDKILTLVYSAITDWAYFKLNKEIRIYFKLILDKIQKLQEGEVLQKSKLFTEITKLLAREVENFSEIHDYLFKLENAGQEIEISSPAVLDDEKYKFLSENTKSEKIFDKKDLEIYIKFCKNVSENLQEILTLSNTTFYFTGDISIPLYLITNVKIDVNGNDIEFQIYSDEVVILNTVFRIKTNEEYQVIMKSLLNMEIVVLKHLLFFGYHETFVFEPVFFDINNSKAVGKVFKLPKENLAIIADIEQEINKNKI
jgi:hypothetical protein